MKTSGIFSALTFSLFLHILLFSAAIFIAGRTINKPSMPYIVSLIEAPSPIVSVPSDNSGIKDKVSHAEKSATKKQTEKSSPDALSAIPRQTQDKSKKEDDTLVKERIAALHAKKRIEKMAALRKMVDIKSQESGVKGRESKTQNSSGGDYYSMVVNKVRHEWIFPENIDKDLEAVVSIRIAKDGAVTIGKMEKSSGNPLFDRSVLRAINKATPLPPPPQEMEIGVRFRP
jgi:TonB family protein